METQRAEGVRRREKEKGSVERDKIGMTREGEERKQTRRDKARET